MICVRTGEHLTDERIIAGDHHAADDIDAEEDEEDIEVIDEAIERPSVAAVNETLHVLGRLSLFSDNGAAMRRSIHDLTTTVSKGYMNN